MYSVSSKKNGDELIISIGGRIDSGNSADAEKDISAAAGGHTGALTLDCSSLEYISSAGLRVILRLRKANGTCRLINVSSEVYEIFDMTGFTEMMDISKAYREVSIEGCEVIGEGANGKVYRIDPDTIVKVYKNPDSLDEIHNERELARKAFVMGIPTAIPYDVVKVGDLYGSVFELLNAKSFAKLIKEDPSSIERYAEECAEVLKTMHTTFLKPGELPETKKAAVKWAEFCLPYLPAEIGEKLLALIKDIPETLNMLHGDYHLKNIMKQNGETLLIDMDTLSMGHPIFEISAMFLAYRGFSSVDRTVIENFMGLTYEQGGIFLNAALRAYFDGRSDEFIADVIEKASVIGYARMLRRTIRKEPDNTAMLEFCKAKLCELVPVTDKFYF